MRLDRAVVLDASALIAIIRGETGSLAVEASINRSIVSSVNVAEAHTKLVSIGLDEQQAWWHISEIPCESVPFDYQQARIAGGLVKVTRSLGLSLGDRTCLALAIHRQAEVYTTDRACKGLSLGIEIHIIR